MELRKGYKQTEVGVIPESWEVKSLGNITDRILGGGTPSRSNTTYWGNEIPWATVKDFATFDPYATQEYITLLGLKKSSSNLIPKGILITSTRMALGKAVIYNNDVAINQDLKALFFNKNIDTKYLYYWFQANSKKIEDLGSGSTVMGVSLVDLKKLFLALPNKNSEQTAIANALSDMDALISSVEQLIEKKKAIKQGAMQELLKPKDGWVTKTLKQVATYRRGSFPQPYGLDKWYDDITGMPFVQVYDVDDNKKLKSETKRRISKDAQKMSIYAPTGTIILTIQGSIGRIAITQYDAYIDRTLLIFESFLVEFDKYFFLWSVYRLFEKEKETAPGGIIKTITKEALSSFPISYPDIAEQRKISATLSLLDDEIAVLELKFKKLTNQKQAMMQVLLTGKIRLV